MEKSYIQKITAFIDNMRDNDEESTPSIDLLPIIDHHIYAPNEIVFNTKASMKASDFTYTQISPDMPNIGFLFSMVYYDDKFTNTYESNFIIQDLSNKELEIDEEHHTMLFPDNTFMILDSNAYIIYISNQVLADLYNNFGYLQITLKVGWQANNLKEIGVLYGNDILSQDSSLGQFSDMYEANEPVWNGISIGATVEGRQEGDNN